MADRIKLRRGPKNKLDLNAYELGYVTDSNEERLYFNNGEMIPIPNNKDITDIKKELTEAINDSTQNKKDVLDLKESVSRINYIEKEIGFDDNKKIKGINYWVNTNTELDKISDTFINGLNEIGITDVFLCVNFGNFSNNSDTSHNYLQRYFGISNIETAIKKLIDSGIDVSVKVHFTNYDGSVVTEKPSDVSIFFENLNTKILEILAVNQGIKYIFVANESPRITCDYDYKTYWETLFNNIRTQNPSIKISNSCTIHEFEKCVFWDISDCIGVNIYPVVADKTNEIPDEKLCERAMYIDYKENEYLNSMYRISKKYNKKVIISEFGTIPAKCQLSNPSNYTELGEANDEVQFNYYSGFINVFKSCNFLSGIAFWVLDKFAMCDTVKQLVKDVNINE